MRKRFVLLAALALCALALSACSAQVASPLARAEATAVPGLAMTLHDATASEENTITATLYFRYGDEPMLASETRALTVRRNESVELAIVRALLDGPGAEHGELKRLLPEGAEAVSTASRGSLLFVTFSAELWKDEIPENWAELDEWREEAPLRRYLAMQSVVCSLTERFAYTGVQMLAQPEGDRNTALRLDASYFLDGRTGLSEPLGRDGSVLLTPGNTAARVLTLWQQRAFDALLGYAAEAGKPAYETAAAELDALPALIDFEIGSASVSEDGQTAVVTIALSATADGRERRVGAYPLRLTRENGLWKLRYDALVSLLEVSAQ